MKQKVLLSLLTIFVLSACNHSPSNKKSSSINQSSINQTSVNQTSINQSSINSTSPSTISSALPSTSGNSKSDSSALPSTSGNSKSEIPSPSVPPIIKSFKLSDTEITIDISKTHEASLTCLNSFNETEPINWSTPHSSVIQFEKETTISGVSNKITAINTGDVRISASAGNNVASCLVHVVNTKVKPTSGTANLSIYAVNDYHGAVNGPLDIRSFGTLIKQKVNQDNTLFLDQGDTWQGQLKSNYNFGRMITDVYNAAGVSARTIGNHDFDWSDEKLIANTAANYHGYSTPVLAANVYDFNFETKEVGSTQQSQIGKEYVTFTMENGLKVGVIGLIGSTCETSINSQFVFDYEFIDEINVIKELSNELRIEENCDIIIGTIHEAYSNYYANQITQVSPESNKRYVDFVLNGHNHQLAINESNGVTFAEFGEKGNYVGKINLTYDFSTQEVTNTNVYSLEASSILNDVDQIDPEIDAIVDHYEAEVEEIKDEVLTNQLTGTFYRDGALANLVCKAMYEESINQNFDISYAVTNYAREDLIGPIVTYETLFSSLPFDNVIYIIQVSGEDLQNELYYNYFYRGNNEEALNPLEPNKTYTIACIDYVAFHCNARREFNYFPSAQIVGYLTKNNAYYVYRDVTADYLRNTTNEVSAASYDSSLDHHNRSKLSSTISQE